MPLVTAIRQHVKVGAGGVIEIRSAELLPGSDAEVIILVEQRNKPASNGGLSQLIGAAKGVYADSAEVDQFIRNERNEWRK